MRFDEFWCRYLAAHRRPGTRAAHYVATLLGAALAIVGVYQADLSYVVFGIALSAAIAIGSHWLIEGNQPLIRVNPLYGAVSDLRMCWLALTGRLHREYEKHHLTARPPTGGEKPGPGQELDHAAVVRRPPVAE